MSNPVIAHLIKLQKQLIKTARGKSGEEIINPYKQQRYINKIREPRTLIDRSYYQYKCQKKRNSGILYRVVMGIANIGAFFYLVFFLLTTKKSCFCDYDHVKNSAVFLADPKSMDRIPESLQLEFDEIIVGGNYSFALGSVERKLIFSLWKTHPFSLMFVLKCAMKIAYYCEAIDCTNAKAVIVTGEDSYTSSALTAYCRMRKVMHINMMHGEVLYSLARTFFAFDRCYVWDDYYVSLFLDLRAAQNQFIVEVPKKLKYPDIYPLTKTITYYLQAQSEEQMQKIRNLLLNTKTDFHIRPHRIWTNMKSVNAVFRESEIEDCEKISIEESIMSTKYLVSICSTTLFQGYINGKQAIIDDLSNPSMFKEITQSKYIMCAHEKSLLLSNFIKTQYT